MVTLDLSVTIAGIIAISAIVSPIATAIINNRHHARMKRMELDHATRTEYFARARELYEGFLRAAGACIHYPSKEALQEFGFRSGSIMYYAPENLLNDIIAFEKIIQDSKTPQSQKIDLLANLAKEIQKI